MRDYELVSILDPGLEDTQIQEVVQKISGLVESNSGVLENVRTSEVRRLAYRIKKKSEGVYVVVNFSSEPTFVQQLDRTLKLEERVLRHRVFVSTSLPPLAQVPGETPLGRGRAEVASSDITDSAVAAGDVAEPTPEESTENTEEVAETAS